MKKASSIRDFINSESNLGGEKLTLTNLFQMQFQKNAQNTIINSSKVRPYTVQNGRQRSQLIKTASGRKIQTQGNLRRQSEYIFKTANKFESEIGEEQKLKIKKIYGRINILADGFQMQEADQISAVFQFLRCLSNTNNYHQKAFNYINNKLQSIVYATKNSNIQEYAKLTKSNFLVKFVTGRAKQVTYKDLLQETILESIKQIKSKFNKDEKNDQNLQKLMEEVQESNLRVLKIKQQLLYYKQHPSQNLYPYIQELNQKNLAQKAIIETMQKQQLQFQTDLDIMRHTNVILATKIQELQKQVYQFQIEKLSNMKEVQKNSQLKDFEDNVDSLKFMLHKSVLRMEGVKQQYDKLKSYNDNLLNERSKLAKRAAVGFQQLTPRPKFRQIFRESELDFEKIIQKQSSTQNVVSFLVKICKELFEQKQKQTIKIGSNFLLKQKQKVNLKEPNIAMTQIQKAQEQVDKTIKSAEEVKKAYNKEKIKRDGLEQTRKK